MEDNKKNIGIYIHIPFCKAKCFYCDFNSFACRDELVPAYFNALKKEIGLYSEKLKDYAVKTVFVGGGTPSLVDAHYIYEVLVLLNRELSIDKSAEITIETNPGTLTYEKLMTYKIMGINRLSIGLQAWQNRILKKLGRIHTVKEFEENFGLARKLGFNNINVDLIFGIPGQTLKDWNETIECVSALQPEHMSCYSLKIEEGTVFGNSLETGELIPIDDSLDREMYQLSIDLLREKNCSHYEISNFSKPGFECRHNLIYWKAEEYIGFGAGAHSFFGSARFNNACDIERYTDSILNGRIPSENNEIISKKEKMAEFMILGLRLIKGIDIDDFSSRFGEEVLSVYGNEINNLADRELLTVSKGFIKLTTVGLDYANQVFMEFI